MPIVDSRIYTLPTEPLRHIALASLIAFVLLGGGLTAAWGQSGPVAKQVAPTTAQSLPPTVVQSGPRWQELSNAQRHILQPLAGTWDSLDPLRKSKWISVAQTYPTRSPAEQEKMQSRMAEWAALKPSDRERARLNFVETKKLPPSDRAADWEAYQGLSAEEKQNLAAKAAGRPTGAAIAVKPVAPNKLTPVPITRRTAQESGTNTSAKPKINPNTLLPTKPAPIVNTPPPVPVVPAVVTESAVAPEAEAPQAAASASETTN